MSGQAFLRKNSSIADYSFKIDQTDPWVWPGLTIMVKTRHRIGESLVHPMRHVPARFETTSWSLILRAAGGGEAETEAVSRVLERYWPAVYAFIRASGSGREEAEDLTQSFFARLLEKKYLQQADRARGRFRSFLLAAVKHFLANESDRVRAKKRGGGVVHVPIDLLSIESSVAPAIATTTPDKCFENRWALSVLQAALEQVRNEMELEGKLADFERLSQFLTGDAEQSFRDLAKQLGATEGSLRVAAHRLRMRFRDSLRRTIAETISNEADIDDEIRFLISALGK